MKQYITLILILLVAISAGSCSGEEKVAVAPPADLISEDVFSDMLLELMLIEKYKEKYAPTDDSMAYKVQGFYNALFEEYNTTKAVYDKSFTYYNGTPERIKKMLESTDVKLKMLEDDVAKDLKNSKSEIIEDNTQKRKQLFPGMRQNRD